MSHFLTRIAARTVGEVPTLRPRPLSSFEPDPVTPEPQPAYHEEPAQPLAPTPPPVPPESAPEPSLAGFAAPAADPGVAPPGGSPPRAPAIAPPEIAPRAAPAAAASAAPTATPPPKPAAAATSAPARPRHRAIAADAALVGPVPEASVQAQQPVMPPDRSRDPAPSWQSAQMGSPAASPAEPDRAASRSTVPPVEAPRLMPAPEPVGAEPGKRKNQGLHQLGPAGARATEPYAAVPPSPAIPVASPERPPPASPATPPSRPEGRRAALFPPQQRRVAPATETAEPPVVDIRIGRLEVRAPAAAAPAPPPRPGPSLDDFLKGRRE